MADELDSKNGYLASSSDKSTSSAVQNDQVFINNDQASSSSSTDYGNGHQNQAQAVENHVKSMVGLRQNAVDNPGLSNGTPISNGKVVDGLNQPVEHLQPFCGMVDRRQSTVEDTDGHAIDKHAVSIDTQFTQAGGQSRKDGEVVDRQKRTVEDDPPSAHVNGVQFTVPGITGNIVDRQKRTVEDDTPSDQVTSANGHGEPNTMQFNSRQPTTSEITSSIVDREKRTVEDEAPSFQGTGANGCTNGTQITGMNQTTSGITSNMVDRQKKTVEDDALSVQRRGANSITGNMVDRQKRTVEDDPSVQGTSTNGTQVTSMQPTTSGVTGNMVDRQKKTVEDDTSFQGTSTNGTQVTSMQPTTSGVTGNMVDRQKRTVEDDTSVQGTSTNGTQVTSMQPTTSGVTGNMVDRQKKTVEDDPSVQGTSTNGTQITSMQPTTSGVTGNMVDRQKKTVEDDPSVQGTNANGTQITGMQPTTSGIIGNMVDREKRTVEDDTPSVQGRQPNRQYGGTELEPQFREGCNISERKRTNSHPEAAKWKIQLHVNNACDRDIIQHLPRSKLFQWNQSVVFGRHPGVDIFINDERASRNHVEVMGQTLRDGQVLFMAKNISRKGYNLNGENITGTDQWIPLKRTDNIRIAGLMCFIDIIPGRDMDGFVIEFKVPSPVVASPVVASPVVAIPTLVLPSPTAHLFHFPPYPNPQPVHPSQYHLPPNNGMPMYSYWSYYGNMQPEQPMHRPYLPGDGDRMQISQPYQEREVYNKLGIDLCHLAKDIVEEWKELGRALGLEDCQIHAIHKDFEGIKEKSYQMLRTWVHRCPDQATLDNLKKALLDVTVEREDLVEKYCTVDNNGE